MHIDQNIPIAAVGGTSRIFLKSSKELNRTTLGIEFHTVGRRTPTSLICSGGGWGRYLRGGRAYFRCQKIASNLLLRIDEC